MSKNPRDKLSRRRFSQGLLAGLAALLHARLPWRKRKPQTPELREAEFYERENDRS